MQTYAVNNKTMSNNLSFLNKVILSLLAGVMICGGFILGLFFLALSAILFPFVACKVWLLKRQFNANKKPASTTEFDKDTAIEGEYFVTETGKDN